VKQRKGRADRAAGDPRDSHGWGDPGLSSLLDEE
jgi:hypothetical protein